MKNLFRYPLTILSIFYFLFRLPHLALLPIFNDESIYLDWGWRMTHVPGFLYYSLYDAKQPLVMWLFGLFETILPDPLFAGRFVSLLLGLLTTIGIFKLGESLFSKKVALIAAITYIVIPIFVLYDRQALMESAIIATNIWAFYFITNSLDQYRSIKNELLAGLTLGLGFFSKSTATLFVISTIAIFLYKYFQSRQTTYLQRLLTIGCAFFTTILLLIINPQYWQTLSSNSRYVLTLSEIFTFPIPLWLSNLWGILQIGFIFVTPIVFIISIVAIKRLGVKKYLIFLLWLGIPMLIAVLTLKSISQRYIVSLLPLLTILFASFFYKTKNSVTYLLLPLALIIPLAMSFILIYNPFAYFINAHKITPFSENSYVIGQISGYGFPETIQYLIEQNKIRPIVVTYAENSGNPESALSVYMTRKDIANGYFELKYLTGMPAQTECIELQDGRDIFFISRDQQLVGFEKFVTKVQSYQKPFNSGSIGIYQFKKGCQNSIKVNPVFHGK